MKLFILLVCIIPSAILANDCGNSDCQCWAPCFKECQSEGLEKEYALIYQTIQTVRGAANSYNVHETAFVFDGSASFSASNLRQIQRNLASILAITTPVGTDCNSFYASQYFRNFAYSFWSWQCQSKCDIADFLQGFGYFNQVGNSDWVGGGCYLGNYFHKLGLCRKEGGRMVVTFQNSDVSTFWINQCFKPNYDVGVAVKLSGNPFSSSILSQLQPVTSDADLFEVDLYGSSDALLKATEKVLSCVSNYCCEDCQLSGRKKRSILEDLEDRAADPVGFYITPGKEEAQPFYDAKEIEGLIEEYQQQEEIPR